MSLPHLIEKWSVFDNYDRILIDILNHNVFRIDGKNTEVQIGWRCKYDSRVVLNPTRTIRDSWHGNLLVVDFEKLPDGIFKVTTRIRFTCERRYVGSSSSWDPEEYTEKKVEILISPDNTSPTSNGKTEAKEIWSKTSNYIYSLMDQVHSLGEKIFYELTAG